MSGDEQEVQIDDLTDQKLVTKYRRAGEIADAALKLVMSQCVPDAKIVDLCNAGDAYITEETGKCYNKPAGIEKGIGFPTCVSVNHVVGHYCPLDGAETKLALGDLVKIDLGVHIDGFVAVVANTVLVGEAGVEKKITGRKADVMAAAWTAAEAAVRLLKPGKNNEDISNAIAKAAAEFKCEPVQGVLSHQMSRFVIDGDKVILNKPDIENKVDLIEFAPNEVYALDIVMSTATGKVKESEERTTIFKRAADSNYQLKMKASRQVYSQVMAKFPTFPFTLRALEEKKAKFGITEMVNHELVHAYPVLNEVEGEFIAHIKFTCLLMPNQSGTVRITGTNLINRADLESEFTVQDKELLAVLATSTSNKKKKKKKKKKQ
jgi:curved DNA binding protein